MPVSCIEKLKKNRDELDKILDAGMEASRKIAKAKYELMKKKIGLRR